MLVKLRVNRLLFVGLSEEQILEVETAAKNSVILKDVSGGMQVSGEKDDLYDLLFELSKTYDLEVM